MDLRASPPPQDRSPGWKADPLGGKKLRYWDGGSWSAHVSRSLSYPAPPPPMHPPVLPAAKPPKDPPGVTFAGGRIRRSWALTTIAWDHARRSGTCLTLALLGVISTGLATAVILYLGGYFNHHSAHARLVLVGIIALYPATLVSVFFNFALAAAAAAALEGRNMSAKTALQFAVRRLDQIAIWAFVAATVGVLLDQIAARLPFGGKFATWLVGAAWGFATMFVVPILALQPDSRALPAVRESSRVFRNRWGEGVSGALTITFWMILLVFPLVFLVCFTAASVSNHPGARVAVAGAGYVTFAMVGAIGAALRQFFTVALFRYAGAGPTGNFPIGELDRPFSRSRRGSVVRNVVLGIAGFIGLLIVIALIAAPPRQGHVHARAGDFSETLAPAFTSLIHDGMPVFFREKRVGYVYSHEELGDGVFVDYHLRPALRGLGWRETSMGVGGVGAEPALLLRAAPWGTYGHFTEVLPPAAFRMTYVGMPVRWHGMTVGSVLDRIDQGGRLRLVYQLRTEFFGRQGDYEVVPGGPQEGQSLLLRVRH